MPIYPASEFIASYDAGRGQRYYIFGTNASYAEAVNYYRTVLKQRGEVVYEEPPVHMFDVGRFREETMAFPPGVTVKDYTWAGSAGYLNPRFGAQPARFKTIIQIVPAPAVAQR
jgi:predicted amidohydrolase